MTNLLKHQDWYLNGAILFLAAASLVMLASISQNFFWPQLLWYILAFGCIVFFSLIDWRPLLNYHWVILGIFSVSVLLLLITLIVAPSIRGARSWLVVGPLRVQTAELAKFALIIILAAFFAKRHMAIAYVKNILFSFLYFFAPAALVLLQPDLGSVLVIFVVWFGFLLISGIRWRHLFAGLIIGAIALSVGWNYFLQDYQKERIAALFNPDYDPLGINYGVIQSKIAIGSAGFWGKGLGQGTQVQLGFLPEAQGDFIFAALIEEWGLLGGFLVLAALGLVIARIINAGMFCDNNFSKLLCLGTAVMLLAQMVFNVGSAIGLLPVVGLSFPFLSYGGSNLIVNAMLVGIIQSIISRR